MTAFKSKKQAAFVFAALIALSLYLAKDISLTCAPAAACENYTVEFDWFGMDAQKIESLIAVPLEEKIGALENLISVSTVCEYSKCKASASFYKSKKSAFFDICAAANELHKELPKDAQHPRIYSSAAESKWLFCAAFDAQKFPRQEIERRLKGPFQNITEASRTIFLGGESEEIQVAFDSGRLCQKGAAPWRLLEIIGQKNAAAFFGNGMAYRERLESPSQINCDKELGQLAAAKIGFKQKDSIVRVNGRECVLASVQSPSESQNIKIASQARKILKKEFPQKGDWQIIYDNGMEQERLLWRLALAFVQSLAALALSVIFFYGSAKKAASVLIWTAAALLFSLAALAALKIPLDGSAISGLTISLGLLCDSALYLSDDCEPSLGAMALSSLTTICAILPLCVLEKRAPGIKALAAACVAALGSSTLLALFFFPLFFKRESSTKKEKNSSPPREFLNLSIFSYKLPKSIIMLSSFLYILPALIFFFSSKNLARPDSSPVICAQAEYPPEKSARFVDQEILKFTSEANKIKGVEFIQSESKRGSAEIQIVLKNPGKKDFVLKELERLSGLISGSLSLPLRGQKKIVQSVAVCVLGDDISLCRRYAKEAAAAVWSRDFFSNNKTQTILNFKDDERILAARPKEASLAKSGMSVQEFSQILRWNLFGAVIHKERFGQEPLDIRAGNKALAFDGQNALLDLNLARAALPLDGDGKAKSVPLLSLCSIESKKAPSRIYRKGGKRAARWTLEAETDKSDKMFKELKLALKNVNLPDGYWFEFPREWESLWQDYAAIFAAFLFALAAIYVLVAAQCERPLDALKAVLTIPISLFLPLLLRAASLAPLTLGDAVGMVFVSGICVNNALYIMSEFNLKKRKDAFLAVQGVLKSVLSSSATTIAASLAPIVMSAGTFAGDLAFFTLFGTLGSVFASVFIFPQTLEEARKKTPRSDFGEQKAARGERKSFILAFRSRRRWELSSSREFLRRWPKLRRQGRT